MADKHYTTKPKKLWADITYRNIASEIETDLEFAAMMGLTVQSTKPPAIEDVLEALNHGDLKEAARLLDLLKEK